MGEENFEGTESERLVAYEQYLEDEIYDYYYGQCAEYCGDSHARMLFELMWLMMRTFMLG